VCVFGGGTSSGQEAPEDRDCGEIETEGKAKELELGPKEGGGVAGRYLWGRFSSCLS
jgi:hypothetical protein